MKGFKVNGRRNNLSDLVIPKLMDDQGRFLVRKIIFVDWTLIFSYCFKQMKKEIDNDMGDGYFDTRIN